MSVTHRNIPPARQLVEVAVECQSGDAQALLAALEASGLGVDANADAPHLAIVSAESETVLLAAIQAVREGFAGEVQTGLPAVSYREGLTVPAAVTLTHKKPKPPQFAQVRISFDMLGYGAGVELVNAVPDGALPKPLAEAVLDGLEAALQNGLVAGYCVTGFRATLIDAAWHDRDSTPLTFQIAARAAFRELRKLGKPVLLEPVMVIEIEAAPQYLAHMESHLRARQVYYLEKTRDPAGLKGKAKLANLLGFEAYAAEFADGTANVSLIFDHWAEVPISTGPGDDTYLSDIGKRA